MNTPTETVKAFLFINNTFQLASTNVASVKKIAAREAVRANVRLEIWTLSTLEKAIGGQNARMMWHRV